MLCININDVIYDVTYAIWYDWWPGGFFICSKVGGSLISQTWGISPSWCNRWGSLSLGAEADDWWTPLPRHLQASTRTGWKDHRSMGGLVLIAASFAKNGIKMDKGFTTMVNQWDLMGIQWFLKEKPFQLLGRLVLNGLAFECLKIFFSASFSFSSNIGDWELHKVGGLKPQSGSAKWFHLKWWSLFETPVLCKGTPKW